MDPPVPIPNTVVKHSYVESTWLETTWEDRKLLVDDAPERVRFLFWNQGISVSTFNKGCSDIFWSMMFVSITLM